MKGKISKIIRGLAWLAVMAAGLVVFLMTTNWLPSLRQEGLARPYDSLDEARESLGLERVAVPAYFPRGISWPPSFILGQKKPYRALVMEFAETERTETALIVIQSSLAGGDQQLQRIRLSEVTEVTQYSLKGLKALLQVGTCNGRHPCSRMTWQNGDTHFTVLLMGSPFELIKIAESMIH